MKPLLKALALLLLVVFGTIALLFERWEQWWEVLLAPKRKKGLWHRHPHRQ